MSAKTRIKRGFTAPELLFVAAAVIFIASVSVALLSSLHRAALETQAAAAADALK